MARRPALVAAMLGVMRAGAAYVPLDPDYPPERLAHMARDAGLTLILTADATLDPSLRQALAETGRGSWARRGGRVAGDVALVRARRPDRALTQEVLDAKKTSPM